MLIYINNAVCVLLYFWGINDFKMLNIQHNRHVHKIVLQITRKKRGNKN